MGQPPPPPEGGSVHRAQQGQSQGVFAHTDDFSEFISELFLSKWVL